MKALVALAPLFKQLLYVLYNIVKHRSHVCLVAELELLLDVGVAVQQQQAGGAGDEQQSEQLPGVPREGGNQPGHPALLPRTLAASCLCNWVRYINNCWLSTVEVDR